MSGMTLHNATNYLKLKKVLKYNRKKMNKGLLKFQNCQILTMQLINDKIIQNIIDQSDNRVLGTVNWCRYFLLQKISPFFFVNRLILN